MGSGCPYRDKDWKTCSRENAKYILYEPNKGDDIDKNESQRLNRQNIPESDYVKGQAEVVSKNEFKQRSAGQQIFYRGQENDQHVLADSSASAGSHAWGRGLYFTTNQATANDTYSKGGQLIQAVVKPTARMISVEQAHQKFKETVGRKPRTNLEVSDFLRDNDICDALYIKHGSTGHENYLLVLNRSILVVNYIRR